MNTIISPQNPVSTGHDYFIEKQNSMLFNDSIELFVNNFREILSNFSKIVPKIQEMCSFLLFDAKHYVNHPVFIRLILLKSLVYSRESYDLRDDECQAVITSILD